MRVFVTGDQGMVGQEVSRLLGQSGDEVVGFDIKNGHDVLNASEVARAASKCNVTVHLAAADDKDDVDVPSELQPGTQGTPDMVTEVTVEGTRNVLEAARMARHQRVVFMSSVDALGIFQGQRLPDYLPIDDDHPTYPSTPYALAKKTAEQMCVNFTERTGVSTLCLRPPGIWSDEIFRIIRKRWRENPLNDRRPFWEYGAFIALTDVAEAVRCAVHNPFRGHATLLIASDDAALAEQTSRQAAMTICPTVRWHGGEEFVNDPFHTLVDNRRARSILHWQPKVRFREIT